MSRTDRFALALSLITILVTYWVADRVFERMAHLEDEMAYVWQAQTIARGQLTVPIPPEPKSFLVPFVLDYNGHRFGKYPLGWPVVLAAGVAVNAREWVNPLLAGFGVWLTYLLGKRLFTPGVGLFAAFLTLTSPFFLLNSGSLLSHPLGLVLSLAFTLAWLDAFTDPRRGSRWLPTLAGAFSLGALILTRPMTAAAVAAPFGLHGLYLLVRGNWDTRRRLVSLGLIVLAIGSLHFLWQYAVTGDPLLNPYTLWWPYDGIGFKPGVGRNPAGHSLQQAVVNARYSLSSGYSDLFGWFKFSWLFLPFGLWASRRNGKALLTASVFVSLVAFYMLYWVGAALFGPRYYYEGLFSLTLLTAAGAFWLAGWPVHPKEPWRWRRIRAVLVILVLSVLISINLRYYIPMRVGGMHALYGIERRDLELFLTPEAQALTPAIVVVYPARWMEYGSLLELQDAFLSTPFIFIHSRGSEKDAAAVSHFPDRRVLHYYLDEPNRLYTSPRSP